MRKLWGICVTLDALLKIQMLCCIVASVLIMDICVCVKDLNLPTRQRKKNGQSKRF